MIVITKKEAKRIKKEFPNFCREITASNNERYLSVSQTSKSTRGRGYLTSTVQFEGGSSNESKIAKLDELMAIMKSLRGIPDAKMAYDKLKSEKCKISNYDNPEVAEYKRLHSDWWNREVWGNGEHKKQHPRWFAEKMGWIKTKSKKQ